MEFRALDIRTQDVSCGFDIVYARFVLSHLANPLDAMVAMHRSLRPGGRIIVEDIDYSGYVVYPESEAFRRYHELYCTVVRKRGGDPNFGLRLPNLLTDVGFEKVELTVVQPMGTNGEVKLLNPITMENIADAVLQDNLASREEIDELVQELYEFAENPRTVAGLPRIFQAWGHKAASLA